MNPRALFALCLTLAASAAHAEPTILSGFSHPESVLLTTSGVYVSNIGAELAPLAHDGDGFISLLDGQGQLLERQAFTGLDAPKGMAVLNGVLYVADIDRVIGFDIKTHERVFAATLPGGAPSLLNDIAVMQGQLLVSDTLRGQIDQLDPGTGTFQVVAEGIPGANGLIWDAARGAAVSVALGADFSGGNVFIWSPQGGLTRVDGAPFGILDGVAALPNGTVIISDWKSLSPVPGSLMVVDPVSGAHSAVDLAVEIHGPADFARDGKTGKLWIPGTLDGTVTVVDGPMPQP
jgi:hypothetical protein